MAGVLIGVLIFAGFVFLIVGVISVFSPQPSVGISTRIRAVAVLFAAIAMMVLAAVLAANNPEFTHDLEARKKELQQQAQRRLRDNLKRQEERAQARVYSAKTPSEKLVDQPVYDPPQKGPVAPSCADWNKLFFFQNTEVSDVRRCLQAGADPNRSSGGMTPLHVVKTAETMTALIEAGGDPNARTKNGWTPLHWAVFEGRAEVVPALLEAGADPNVRGKYGNTPLHIAASHATAEVVRALLEAGGDPNTQSKGDDTPLHAAARGGTAEVVMALLEAGADPAVRDNDHELPVDHATNNKQLRETDAYGKLAAPKATQQKLAERAGLAARIECPEYIERLARYTVRWTDGFLESKFSHSRRTKTPNVITYIGDHIEFQNGFGAWQPHIYECDLNVETKQVVDVRARPGRLP